MDLFDLIGGTAKESVYKQYLTRRAVERHRKRRSVSKGFLQRQITGIDPQ